MVPFHGCLVIEVAALRERMVCHAREGNPAAEDPFVEY